MRWATASLIFAGVLLTLGLVSSAQAEPKMFSGSLIFHSGNDVTTGASYPSTAYVLSVYPLGAFCNPMVAGGVSCGTATLNQGAPLTGNGTVSVTGPAPAGFTIPSNQLFRTTSGSLPPPYPTTAFFKTYATLANATGVFGAGGGPGSFTFSPTVGLGMTKVVVSAGSNQFGGVMQLLGSLGAVSRVASVYNTYYGATGFYTFVGRWPTAGATIAGGPYATTAMLSGAYTVMVRFHSPSSTSYFSSISSPIAGVATGFPWTTGRVSVSAIGDIGYFPEILARSGYDNRTPSGAGRIQLVTPQLTHWIGAGHSGQIAILRLEFVPEPSRWLLLAAGLGCVVVLYRVRGARLH